MIRNPNLRLSSRAWRDVAMMSLTLVGLAAAAQQQRAARPPAPFTSVTSTPASATAASPADAALDSVSRMAESDSTRELNLTQLGINYAVQLRGVNGTVGIPFGVRVDELVTQASLKLNYSYSPTMIPELSHLKVSVNDVLVATLPVSQADGGKALSREIPIDRRLITEFNRINIELVGHYTRECEDPLHSSLWAKIDSSSTLSLKTTRLKLNSDLATLPQPFFDRHDIRRARVPVVLGTTAPHVLEAAGVVASWLGAQADYRGAQFPVTLGSLPSTGNAVVFATPETKFVGFAIPPIQGPTLTVIENPSDPRGKLLLVMGRNADELRTAAAAVSLNSRAFNGADALVSDFQTPAQRKPYDAPRWIPTDRPVQLSELAKEADFTVAGYTPDVIRVNFQLPPDLFTWRAKGIPLDLQYRYTPRVRPDQSTLNINVNDTFIGALPLRAANGKADQWWNVMLTPLLADGTRTEGRQVQMPPLALTARNELRLHYYFEPAASKCVPLVDNVSGAVDPRSTLDASGLPHYIAMPEIATFANSGFPFTRLADLGDTAVILPDQPTASDVETYLGLMGLIGRATGYPALRMQVGQAVNVERWADKDLLVLGSQQRQPLFTQWSAHLPAQQNGSATQWRLTRWLSDASDLIVGTHSRGDLPTAAPMTSTSDGPYSTVAGFESPLRSGRSVIAVITPEGSQGSLMNALLTPELLSRFQGSLAVIRENQVQSLLGQEVYYVGKLPPITWLQWHLSRSPLLLIGISLAIAFLGAATAYASLRLRAMRRLRNAEQLPR